MAIQKKPKFSHYALFYVRYFIKNFSLAPFKILCTLKLGYLVTTFYVIYWFESATIKSTKFIQKTVFFSSNAILGGHVF